MSSEHTLPPDCLHLPVRPWPDPVLDAVGHHARSAYVERFWLSSLGPSATLLLRYLADRFETAPAGFDLDLAACARGLGLGGVSSRHGGSALPRTLARCCQFRLARLVDGPTLEARLSLPPLNARQIGRLPEPLRREHSSWQRPRSA